MIAGRELEFSVMSREMTLRNAEISSNLGGADSLLQRWLSKTSPYLTSKKLLSLLISFIWARALECCCCVDATPKEWRASLEKLANNDVFFIRLLLFPPSASVLKEFFFFRMLSYRHCHLLLILLLSQSPFMETPLELST